MRHQRHGYQGYPLRLISLSASPARPLQPATCTISIKRTAFHRRPTSTSPLSFHQQRRFSERCSSRRLTGASLRRFKSHPRFQITVVGPPPPTSGREVRPFAFLARLPLPLLLPCLIARPKRNLSASAQRPLPVP